MRETGGWEYLVGNQEVGWLKDGKRAERHICTKSCKVGMLMPQESVSETPAKLLAAALQHGKSLGQRRGSWSEIAASVPITLHSISIPSFASRLRQIRQKNSKQPQVLKRR